MPCFYCVCSCCVKKTGVSHNPLTGSVRQPGKDLLLLSLFIYLFISSHLGQILSGGADEQDSCERRRQLFLLEVSVKRIHLRILYHKDRAK